MQGGNKDNMEYHQDMFTYASNGDGTAHVDNQTNTDIDIHNTHNVPQRNDTDLLSWFDTSDQIAILCSAATQTTEPVVSVSIQTDQVNRPTQCIAVQHLVLKK